MHSKSSGTSSTCYKYVDSSSKGCGRLSKEGGEGIPKEGGRYCADTRHGVSREGCFFEGWRGVPFPSSRWRFYNIHPTCTHVEMVIFVPAFPPPVYLSLWQRRKIPWQRDIERRQRSWLSHLLIAWVCCRCLLLYHVRSSTLQKSEFRSYGTRYRRLQE